MAITAEVIALLYAGRGGSPLTSEIGGPSCNRKQHCASSRLADKIARSLRHYWSVLTRRISSFAQCWSNCCNKFELLRMVTTPACAKAFGGCPQASPYIVTAPR